MALPTDRKSFKSWCLRNLGDGAIKVNVTDAQVDDRVDEALKMFADYHFDGKERIFLKHQVTQTDVDNSYIDLSDAAITDVIKIWDITGITGQASLFDIRYQIALNDLYTLTQVSMVPFFQTMQHLSLLEQMLTGGVPIRFNRFQNRIMIDMDWKKINVGQYMIIEAERIVDPTQYPQVWQDQWLMTYATALIKRQWGTNLGKMTIQLPGGISYNGLQILADAKAEIAELKERLENDYMMPYGFEIG